MKFLNFSMKLLIFVILVLGLEKCQKPEGPVGVSGLSVSNYTVGVSAIYGATSLPADGSSQATIKVEVWHTSGNKFVDDVPVTLTATLGTLASSSLTTTNGVALTAFTAGTVSGNATVTATVENISVIATIILDGF